MSDEVAYIISFPLRDTTASRASISDDDERAHLAYY